jgi:hypothetical protein
MSLLSTVAFLRMLQLDVQSAVSREDKSRDMIDEWFEAPIEHIV